MIKFQKFMLGAFLVFLGFLKAETTFSQIITADEMPRGLYYYKMKRIDKFKEMKSMQDLFHSDKYLMGRNIFSGNVSFNTSRVMYNDGKQLLTQYRISPGLFIRTLIFEEFSFNTTFYKNFGAIGARQWIPDFTYSIGRYHWKPKTWNFGYENYNSNKFTDDFNSLWRKFKEGYLFLSYSHLLPEKIINYLRIDYSSNFRVSYFLRYAANFTDLKNSTQQGVLDGKLYSGIYFRYTMLRNIFIETGLFYYFDQKRTKQPWDPDWSYAFGYLDWRPFRVSFNYSNYSINKFPWNKNQNIYSYHGFLDGNFRLVFNYNW